MAKDISQDEFMAEVIDASQTQIVIVDFWATWCQPCKTLGPALESAIEKRKDRMKMVKIDVDQNQELSAQLRIQSMPTVYAFFQGQPIDAFSGALPPPQIEEFLNNLEAKIGDMPLSPQAENAGDIEAALDQAEALIEADQAQTAAQIYASILNENPTNKRAIIGLATLILETGDIERAEQILTHLEEADKGDAHILEKKISILKAAAQAAPKDELLTKIETNTKDHQARLELADVLMAEGDIEGAFEQLFTSFAQDREWNEAMVKNKIIETLDALDPKQALSGKMRRRFSSMIFA